LFEQTVVLLSLWLYALVQVHQLHVVVFWVLALEGWLAVVEWVVRWVSWNFLDDSVGAGLSQGNQSVAGIEEFSEPELSQNSCKLEISAKSSSQALNPLDSYFLHSTFCEVNSSLSACWNPSQALAISVNQLTSITGKRRVVGIGRDSCAISPLRVSISSIISSNVSQHHGSLSELSDCSWEGGDWVLPSVVFVNLGLIVQVDG
jgi:hypothetical protein